jgi:hypothetical protein
VGLRQLHEDFAWFVVVANGAVGVWALGAHWLQAWRRAALWWATAVAEVAIFVQVALGVAIVAVDDLDPPQFHMFYGFVALITVGIIYSYRQQLAQWRYLLYGLGGLFLMGLAIRAMVLDPT